MSPTVWASPVRDALVRSSRGQADDAVLEVVRAETQWNYLFLTKSPARLVDIDWPDNAWVGTTVDCQARVKPAVEAFKQIRATVRFLCCEPLREQLDFPTLKCFDWAIIGPLADLANS
jgi:protein gp37